MTGDGWNTTAGPPVVSAVIPCYNGERFIGDAIESILAQTFDDFEIIVVDDGSTDRSRERVASIRDPRVRLIAHPENRGIAAARNTAIQAASGRYVAFLDQDDLWHPEKLARQVARMERDDAGDIGLVFTLRDIRRGPRRRRRPADLSFPRPIDRASRREVLEALFEDNFIPMISVLVRRECFDAIGLLDETIRSGADDYDFCVRVASRYRLACIDRELVTRHEHSGNFTSALNLTPDDLKILDRIIEVEPALSARRPMRESELWTRYGNAMQNSGRRREARQAFRDALRARPANVRAALGFALAGLGPVGGGILKIWRRIRRVDDMRPS